MRRVTKVVVIDGFMRGKPARLDNTETDGKILRLFGNPIAEWTSDGLIISTCGWPSPTTLDRLCAIPGVSIRKRNGTLFIDGQEWDGSDKLIHSKPPS